MKRSFLIVIFVLMLLPVRVAFSATQIAWWHAMSGPLGEHVQSIVEEFNTYQSTYKVVPVYKGSYAETLKAGIAAYQEGKPPHILQVYEVGTTTMMAASGAVRPVQELVADYGGNFDLDDILPAIASYYTTTAGDMLSLPFNSSTPVLFYNKKAFKKAGLDPEKPPKTWQQMEEYGKKLLAAGYPCGFSTSWFSWIHIENLGAWHNVPVGSWGNGFEGLSTRLLINSPLFVRHLKKLSEWQQSGLFFYGGLGNKSSARFIAEECAMYTESSAGYAGFKAKAGFEFGIGTLPFWADVARAPQNTIIGGASLWIFDSHKTEEYKGVAKFLSHLSNAEVQAHWHQETGYLPITMAAVSHAQNDKDAAKKNPGAQTALLQLTLHPPTHNSKGMRFGNMVWVRDRIGDEIDALFAAKKTVKEALDAAVVEGNIILRKFEEQTAK